MIAAISDLAWMQALGWTLIHFLWQGAIVGINFAMVRRLVPSEQSSLRYAFGLFSLFALVMAPVLTLALLWPSGGLEAVQANDSIIVNASLASSVTAANATSAFESLLPVLVVAWLAGVLLMVGRAVHQWRSLEQIARRLAWRDLEIEQMLLRVAQRFGALPGVRVLVSASIDTPTLIGWLKPVILLPMAVVAGFPRQQLELILAHELGHLRRYDHLVNLAQAIVETLLFYHPVVHWISREVRHEREICCDNLVLRLTDSEPREYARTLAALENLRQLTPQLSVAASGGMLLDRVRRIVGSAHPHPRGRRSRLGVWLAAAGGSLIVAAAVLFSRTDIEPEADAFAPLASLDVVYAKPAINLELEIPLPALAFAQVHMPIESFAAVLVDAAPAIRSVAQNEQGHTVPSSAKTIEPTVVAAPVETQSQPIASVERIDVGIQHAPIALVTPADAGPAAAVPKIVRMVAPDYPESGFGRPHAKVGFEFSIDRGGRVRNIHMLSGDTQSPFAVAARNALRQWKFDPGSLTVRADEKFQQDFEFVGDSSGAGNAEDGSCAKLTGSHVCRPGRPVAQVRKDEERLAAMVKVSRLDVAEVETADRCTPAVGSHVCRPYDAIDPAVKTGQLQPTLKETNFLAGGTN